MKRITLLLMSVLLYATSAWAIDVTVGPSTGTYYDSDGNPNPTNGWGPTWKSTASASNGTTPLLTFTGQTGMNITNGDIYSKQTYTLTAPTGYVIVGYTFNGTATDDDITITPAGGTGTTITNGSNLGTPLAVNVNAKTTTFALSSSGDAHFENLALTVTVKARNLPQLTTNPNSPRYYSIKSYNRGGYLSSNGSGQAMTHVDFKDGSVWYFTTADGNTSGDATGGVIAHCFDGTQMTTSWQTNETGGTVYILPNGVNENGFSISKTATISNNSCVDAKNSNTGVGDWDPRSNDWEGTTWVIEPTIPSGYYYFKGMDTSRYPYLYSNFVGKSENDTYHHSPLSGTNGEIWKVTNNGSSLSIINGEGLPLTIGTTTYGTLNIGSVAEGPDFYFTQAINLTNWGNDTKLTTWTGHPDATDNHWTFEAADVSAGLYNVVIEGHADGYVTYNGQNAKNGGFFVAASITDGDITIHDITDYATSVTIEDHTITIVYTHAIDYTLTDANGTTYTGSYSGIVGEQPVFTGCAGYSLSDITWDGYSFTATINFPFAVSTSTFLGQFHNKSGYNSIDYLWHAESTGVVVHSGDMPDETSAEQNKYLWTIEPAISGLNITFGIKNVATDTYITSTETGNSHSSGAVTLSETATPLQYKESTTTNCGTIYVWYIPSTGKYLSVNSVNGGAGSLLGVWGLSASHDGPSTGFHTYLDLISRYWVKNEVASKLAKAGQYGYPAIDNEYTVALNGVQAALARSSYPGDATNYNNLRTWYAGFLAAEKVTPADGTFIKIRSILGANACLKAADAGSRMTFTTTEDKNTIFLFYDGKLIAYTHGIAVNNVREIGTVGGAASTFSFVNAVNGDCGLSLAATFKGNTNYLYSTGADNSDADRNTSDSRYVNNNTFTIEPVTSLPVTISKYGMRTFSAPVALTIPSGVHAYTVSISGTAVTLTEVETTIPANTPVILYNHDVEWNDEAVTGTEQTYDFAIDKENTENPLECVLSSIFVTKAKETNDLTLQYDLINKVFGFWKASGENINGFSAYLEWNDSYSNVRRFVITTPSTGIESVQETPMLDKNIYDVQGRRVGKASKGLYIINGKKVIL